MLPNRRPLGRLGCWPPTRLQLGDIVRRWSPASPRTSICALSIVVRLQLLLRLGVRVVTPLIIDNDAFEHLVRLHSCSGSLGVMNARRLSHLKNAGASAALEIALQDVLADVQQHISLRTVDMAQCVSDFSAINNVDMRVCASCGTRDPESLTTRTLAR